MLPTHHYASKNNLSAAIVLYPNLQQGRLEPTRYHGYLAILKQSIRGNLHIFILNPVTSILRIILCHTWVFICFLLF